MSPISRRKFIAAASAAGTAAALGGLAFRGRLDPVEAARLTAGPGSGGYGPLAAAKAAGTAETLLELPKGFRYSVVSRAGSRMSDGNLVPSKPDGMAAFEVDGELRLVRNHEVSSRTGLPGSAIAAKGPSYDPLAGGGTTTLVVDASTRRLVKEFASLSGTLVNCAGGPTPWGSWISCEETVLGPFQGRDATGVAFGGFEREHGYCFEVPAAADGPVDPAPLKAMGRFVHEAVAVDPATGAVFETEDRDPGGLFRYLPREPGRLAAGGRLQMLAVKGRGGYDARTGQRVGEPLEVAWVEIAKPDPPEAATDPSAVFKEGRAKGGASFARLEGCWYGNGRIYVTATSGGEARLGQVWELRPDGDTLTLLFESPGAELLDYPDNVCVSPRGALLLCEDGRGEQFVRGLTNDGRIFDFARNVVPGFESAEFAGATFSPDGETLFLNVYTPGITLAIWGPWSDGAL